MQPCHGDPRTEVTWRCNARRPRPSRPGVSVALRSPVEAGRRRHPGGCRRGLPPPRFFFDRLRLRYRVTTVGNAAPRVVERVSSPGRRLHPHVLHGHYALIRAEYTRSREHIQPTHPRDHEKRSALFNSGLRRWKRWRTPSRCPLGHRPGRDRGVRPRTTAEPTWRCPSPRRTSPTSIDSGPFAARLPVPDGHPYLWPRRICADERSNTFVSTVHNQVGEQTPTAVPIEPAPCEGGFIVPRRPVTWPGSRKWCRDNDNPFHYHADEIQPVFCRTGDCSPANTRTW